MVNPCSKYRAHCGFHNVPTSLQVSLQGKNEVAEKQSLVKYCYKHVEFGVTQLPQESSLYEVQLMSDVNCHFLTVMIHTNFGNACFFLKQKLRNLEEVDIIYFISHKCCGEKRMESALVTNARIL